MVVSNYSHNLGVIHYNPLQIQSPSQWMIGGVQSPSKRKVFRFHETILSFGEPGSLGKINPCQVG